MSDFRRSVTITIDTEAASFRNEDESLERMTVGLLLGRAAAKIEAGEDSGRLLDYNGATVGSFTVTEKES